MQPEYDDDYGTCARTYATFCLDHEALDPEMVSQELGIAPTDTHNRGEINHPQAQDPYIHTRGGWYLSSDGAVSSRDARRHVDWLLDRLEPGGAALQRLQAAGCQTDIFCYWSCAANHGGPRLSPAQMARLAHLDIEISFDIYFTGDDE